MCVEIPAAPDGPIPANARAKGYDCRVAYDLVWVRLNSEVETAIPLPKKFSKIFPNI